MNRFEVDPVRRTEVVQQDLVDLVPDARGLPVAKWFHRLTPQPHSPSPRQVLPGQAGLEDADDPREDLAIIQEGTSPFGLRGMRRDQRLNQDPEFVRKQRLGHDEVLSHRAKVE